MHSLPLMIASGFSMSKQEVKLIGADLQIGESVDGLECPFCRATHEHKFGVTRTENGLLYGCWRASCSGSGFIPTGAADFEKVRPSKKPPKPYRFPLHDLTEEDLQFFQDTWGLEMGDEKVTERDEYAFPILDPRGYRKGWVIRQPRWKGVTCGRTGQEGYPKALTFKDDPDHSRLSWPISPSEYHPGSTVVVVEDYLSALKIVQATEGRIRACALNGADMGNHEAKEIAQVSPHEVVIWLDPDATGAAYRLQAKYGLAFPLCRVTTSELDPKDMSPDVIRHRFKEDLYA